MDNDQHSPSMDPEDITDQEIGGNMIRFKYCGKPYIVTVSAEEDQEKNIEIEVRGGVVQEVTNLPPGWTYSVLDHDI
jgi:hypothetical protein